MKRELEIDFICVGFQKCGTTSLQELLSQNKELYLSERKETWFFQWKNSYDNPLKKLKEDFFSDASIEKKWGIIDPTFIEYSRQVCNYFGKRCKIIFMVRNPVEVVYSDFKMKLRTCQDEAVIKLYHKYGYRQIDKMFREYVESYIKDKKLPKYYFSNRIKRYKAFYKSEDIYFILMEKLIQNPAEELRKLEEFLGTGNYSYEMVRENEGGVVSKNYLCALINKWVFKLHTKLYSVSMSMKARQKIYKVRGFIFNTTQTKYEPKMSKVTKKRLEKYFNDEKEVMKKLTGEDLDKLWF